MNQGGKHAAEPARVDNKRERRRGAAGRAAVLRRAPSDSDCSGETASLSADSGERAPRPAPLAPPRAGKTRSRRRGSEWEVLEGLKDGQRFEKRPDVFNGYLHKKRKWPLKGWHKRFFVVDGGILVYARSPTDVARGRLHGSVDVGLSVISAKARRRRIDIDADEFIYHLRAKTPELFRTWLNVLKAHRLYRQHLLTFGARESAPKIHPPLEDLPPNDNSSHASLSSDSTTVTSIENLYPDPSNPIPKSPLGIEPSENNNKDHSIIFKWQQDPLSITSLTPLNFESLEQDLEKCLNDSIMGETDNMFDLKFGDTMYRNISMCSMKCVAKRRGMMPVKNKKSTPEISLKSTDAEKQMTCTDLDLNLNPPKITKEQSNAPMINKPMLMRRNNSPIDRKTNTTKDIIKSKDNVNHKYHMPVQKQSPFVHRNHKDDTTACYFFTRKKNKSDLANSQMKKSKKCTNLVKYKNACDEPPLKSLTSKCMLLGKYKLVVNDSAAEKAKLIVDASRIDKVNRKAVACNVDVVLKENNEVQVMAITEHKGSQKVAMPVDYDKISEKLLVNIFDKCNTGRKQDVKFYIEQVIHDLYNIKMNQEMHPVKALFRNLLEYWLKNTSVSQFKHAMTNDKSVDQSKTNLSKDANLSSFFIKMKSKETQFRGLDDVKLPCKCNGNTTTHDASPLVTRQKVKETKYENKCHSPLPRCHSPRRDTASFEKERRIQELERLLKSTVYMCELGSNNIKKEKDIEITKQLIEHIGVLSKNNIWEKDSGDKSVIQNSGSSAEIPEIQKTINHLLSETAIPPEVAKEFLGVYLDVLMQGSSKSASTSQSSDWEHSKEIANCEVVGEAVIKKVSKSVTTLSVTKVNEQKSNAPNSDAVTDTEKLIDPGQVYLKDILDKVTTIFSKVKNMEDHTLLQNKPIEDPIAAKDNVQKTIKDELGRPVIKSKYDLIYENCDQNSLVIDLSKYNLEHIAMFNDPAIKDMMSITIKLKEKPLNHGEEKSTHLSFKFPDDAKPITVTSVEKCNNWLPFLNAHNASSNDIFQKLDSNKVTCNFEANMNKEDPKLYFSNISDGTSKARRFRDDSCNSSDVPNTTQTYFTKDTLLDKKENEDLCYLMSIKKGALASKFQSKKYVINKQYECDGSTRLADQSPNKSPVFNKTDELSVFEKPTPKTIDEKFILLLLENLSYISKSVASMHKDINTLYVKLKKKYEKFSKNSNNLQGLSLLGKIYSEDTFYKDGDDKGTQCDPTVQEVPYKVKETKHASTNTNIIKIGEKIACTYTHTPTLNNSIAQTENIYIVSLNISSSSQELSFNSKTSKRDMIVTETNTVDVNTTEQATSNPNWCKVPTMEAAVNTIVRYVTRDAVRIGPFKSTRPFSFEKQANTKHFSRVKEELIKEISLLPPAVKVSTQAQTDKQLIRFFMDKQERERKDTYIYQLFKSKKCAVTSSSVICSNLDINISDDIRTLYRCSSYPSICSGLLSPTTPTIRGPQAGFVSGTPGGRFAGWIIESGGPLEVAARELGQAQLSVQQLQRLLDALELQHQHHDTDVSLEGASPNVKKDRRKFGLRKKKSNSKCASVELAPPHIDPSSSHTALSSLSALTAPPSPGGGACSASNSAASLPIACAAARPQSLPGADTLNTAQGPASITSLTPDHQLREDFTVLAKDLVASLKGVVSSLVCERGRLRAALDAAEAAATPGGAVMTALRTNLTSALQQNSELRTRLSRIHDASDIAEILSVANSEIVTRQFQQSLSYSSSCVSASEFFDAEEHEDDDPQQGDIPADEAGVIELDGDSSSEAGSLSSEEGSASSDNSDGAMLSAEQVTLRHSSNGTARPPSCWTRRTRLPTPRPSPGGPSLWNLLYKNIGKDLSQISMPVTINEPLNMLQRLCEELEYSELLDSAASCGSAVERAALVAAFAVSAYAASAHRAASKPFNPLLAETYECVRDDRSFRFLAEQVSHHPPISACHAESPRWCFWQEARIKTKFWGKSMEFQPTGRVHVRLNTTGDHYTWNKVTTCVHNLFGGQRWVDQYGDMHIVCVGTDISCKLNFVKASSWSQTRHEVRGAVTEASSGTRLRLAGRWSEALYAGEPPAARCLWRPGAMPPEHELYYGFTRFAMELNEIEPGMRDLLPHTDTRLRPDQRALEEGDVESAESYKLSLEQAQRERRRESPTHHPAWFRKTVDEGEETWVFSGEYWKAREAGFSEPVHRIW